MVNAGGAFDLAGFAETVASLSSASSTTGGLVTNSGAAATLTISSATGSTTFGGVITNGTNALNLAKTGASTQVLSGQNTYTGTTVVSGGTLEIASGGSLRGSSSLTVSGGAIFRISSSTNNVVSFTNPTTFTPVTLGAGGGTLQLANTLSGNSQRFAALTLSAAGTLDFGTGNSNSLAFTSLTGVPANTLTISNWSGVTYLLGTTADSGLATQDRLLFNTLAGTDGTAIAGFNFTNDAGVLIGHGMKLQNAATAATPNEVVAVADSTAYWSGNFGTNVWGDGSATNTNWWTTAAGTTVATIPGIGTNVFITANAPTNTYATTLLNTNYEINSLTFTGTGTANTAGSIIASGAGGPFSLTLDGASGITVASGSGANTISTNVVLGTAATQTWANNSTSLLTVSGGVSGTNKNLVVTTTAGGGDTTISGSVILGNGTVTKSGAGTLSFTGVTANTYTGLTTVSGGELDLGKTGVNAIGGSLTVTAGTAKLTGTGGDQIANSGTVTVNGATAAFDLNGKTETVAGVSLQGGGTIQDVATGGALTSTTNFDMQSGTATAVLTGSVGLDKTTAGTVILGGANSYTGATTVTTGILRVQNATGLGTTAAGTSVTSGATLQIDNVSVVGEALTLNGTGVGNAGALTGTGTAASSGTVSLATDSSVGVTAGGDTLTLSGVISGSGTGLTKVGAGTVALSGANTYTGATAVSGGTLQLGSGGSTGSISTASAISVASGATFAVNQTDTVVQGTDFSGAAITGAGNVTQAGSGTTVLTAANSYGTTTVTGGTLLVGNNASTTATTGTGAVTVGDGTNAAVLGGTGIVTGNTTINNAATLQAGDSTASGINQNGTLTFGTTLAPVNLTMQSSSSLEIQISAPSQTAALTFVLGQYVYNSTTYNDAGTLFGAEATARSTWDIAPSSSTNHDYINVTGTFTLDGTVKILENGTVGYAAGQVFNVIDWANINATGFNAGSGFTAGGSFADFNLPNLSSLNLAWDTSAFTSYGILVIVPEVSRTLLLMLGLFGLMMRRRRRSVR